MKKIVFITAIVASLLLLTFSVSASEETVDKDYTGLEYARSIYIEDADGGYTVKLKLTAYPDFKGSDGDGYVNKVSEECELLIGNIIPLYNTNIGWYMWADVLSESVDKRVDIATLFIGSVSPNSTVLSERYFKNMPYLDGDIDATYTFAGAVCHGIPNGSYDKKYYVNNVWEEVTIQTSLDNIKASYGV